MIVFRVRYSPGHHVHCRVFVATDSSTYASMGTLTMTRSEFVTFRKKFDAEFVENEKESA